MMKRILGLAGSAALLAALAPSAGATTAATQEKVRHITTVPGNTGGHVVAEGDRLYMGNYGTGLSAYDISDPRNPVKTGQYLPGPSNTDGADPGIRADAPPDAAVWDGRHIVSLGGTNRTANRIQTEFIDFTDPANPVLLHRMLGGSDRESHNGDIVDARKLWLPSGGRSNTGLRIYDMSPLLQDPPAAPTSLFSGNPHTLWQSSPYKDEFEKPLGSPFDHTHDIEVYTDKRILLGPWDWVDQDDDGVPDPTYGERDIALLAAATGYTIPGSGANTGAVYVIDITDPASPVVITKWQNPTSGNPIRYLHEVQFIEGLENTIVVTDEDLHGGCNEGALYTVALSENLVDATKLDEWTVGAGQAGTPACMGSHVLSSKGGYIFMGAYISGLQVIDARDPANLTRAGQYIAEGMNSWGALYYDGYVYVGDFGARGLDVFEFFPEAQSALLKVGNPASRLAPVGGGISEILGACDPDADTNDVDGMLVEIPEDKRDGTHTIRASGAADAPYDLDVYFWSEDCIYMSGIHDGAPPADPTNPLAGDVQGLIPEEAAYAYVDLWAGPPTYVYAQIDPTDL